MRRHVTTELSWKKVIFNLLEPNKKNEEANFNMFIKYLFCASFHETFLIISTAINLFPHQTPTTLYYLEYLSHFIFSFKYTFSLLDLEQSESRDGTSSFDCFCLHLNTLSLN